jgi:hypothetical protein
MAIVGFAPAGGVSVGCTGSTVSYAIPAGTTALVSNLGSTPVFVMLGATAAVLATSASPCVMPGQQLALTTGGDGFMAVLGGAGGGVNIQVGT